MLYFDMTITAGGSMFLFRVAAGADMMERYAAGARFTKTNRTMKGRLLYSFFEYKGLTYQVRATKVANRCSMCHAQPCRDRKIATLIKYFGPCLGEERSDGIDVIFRKVKLRQ